MKAPLHAALLPLLDGFGAAWELVDGALLAELGEGPLVLRDGVDRAGLGSLRVELAGRLEGVRALELSARLARGRGAALRLEVLGRLKLFNAAARAWWGRTAEGAGIPDAEPPDRALDKFLQPVRDALRLWARLDAGVAPPGVVLPLVVGGLTRGDFAVLMAELLAAREAEEVAEFELKIARRERDLTEDRARGALAGFTRAAGVRLGEEHPAVTCAPRLYPPAGHTPEPVKSEGSWDAAADRARISWEASGDEALSHYEVRWCRGEGYDKKKERPAGRVEAGAERVLLTMAGLPKPGAVATFRVYVVVKSGNERAGNPVSVWRGGMKNEE